MRARLLFVVGVVLALVAPLGAQGLDLDAPATLRVTPDRVVELSSGTVHPTAHPIAKAFRLSRRGDVIELEPGNYRGFLMGNSNPHRQDNVPEGVQRIVVRARIPGSVQLTTPGSDTIIIQQPADSVPFADIAFVGLEIETGTASAIRFSKADTYWGFEFHDIHITGGDRNPLWGVRIYSAGDTLFNRVLIEDITFEHGIYASNNVGRFVVRDSTIRNVGRAAIQLREVDLNEEPSIQPSSGKVRILNNVFEDTGKYDGASALTLQGSHIVEVIGNAFINGFGPDMRSRGAIVASSDPKYGKSHANECLLLQDNLIFYQNPDRAVVSVTSTGNAMLRDNVVVTNSVIYPAVDIDVAGRGPLNGTFSMTGTVFDRHTVATPKRVRDMGQLLSTMQIRALAPPPSFSWRCDY